MQNVQVTYDTSTNNARSESSVAINPNNPDQIVAASKKFADIQTYDFTLATEYSTDGGNTWQASPELALPEGATVMTDPTLAWDDSNNVFLVGLTGYDPPTWDTIGIVIYRSSDGGQSWSAPNPIHNSTADDKQWVAGDASTSSPFRGNVYTVWDNDSTRSPGRPTTARPGRGRPEQQLAPRSPPAARCIQRSPSRTPAPSMSSRPTRRHWSR